MRPAFLHTTGLLGRKQRTILKILALGIHIVDSLTTDSFLILSKESPSVDVPAVDRERT